MEEQKKFIRKNLICKREARKNFMSPVKTNQPVCPKCKGLLLLSNEIGKYHCYFCDRDFESAICEMRKVYFRDYEMLAMILKNKGISQPFCERSKN